MRLGIKVTPAFVVASLALVVVASGGTAYAATKIGSAEIRDNSIRGVDIRSNEVRSSDVKDGALQPRDFAPGTLTSGSKGDKGDTGDAGVGRWLLVDASGAIVAQSGGFSIASAYDQPGAPAGAVGNVYIDANEDLSDNGIAVTVALQNATDQNADTITNGRSLNPDANPEFSGEITSTMCGIAGVVTCAPTGTNDRTHLVVSPRLSDGQVTTSTNRKRFYVTISGDSTDLTSDIPAVALPANAPQG
ncbi:hypothetical protein IFT73_03960 [Aeromicrobium sp. CFBP 8757]|uniref:hypothetical protein n=1 Tax=Aeromicrobium sp. CFBP 8757 TaxID=2775288 RepID=UPI001782EB37|nr:hypothetical protein [Aeromicrobium sp. CFBP 8757]MBD8605998.1 hypothetical protein [Aeromicrobium sp. CFBP 8757]